MRAANGQPACTPGEWPRVKLGRTIVIMVRRRSCEIVCTSLLGAAALCSLAGCGSPSAGRRQLYSDNALDRARAVVSVGEAGDAAAVHRLVDLLADRDAAVRMLAIRALRRLCGQDYEYRYYDPLIDRAAAVRRWRDALRAGEVVVLAHGSTGAAETHTSGAIRSDASGAGDRPREGASHE